MPQMQHFTKKLRVEYIFSDAPLTTTACFIASEVTDFCIYYIFLYF